MTAAAALPLHVPSAPSALPAVFWLAGIVLAGLAVLGLLSWRRSRLHARRTATRLNRLTRFQSALAATASDLDDLAELAYQEAASDFACDAFQLGVFEGPAFRPLIWVRDGEQLENVLLPLADGARSWLTTLRQDGQTRVIRRDADGANLMSAGGDCLPDAASALILPLQSGDRILGALCLQSRRPDAFNELDIAAATSMAAALSAALAQALLQADLRYRTLQLVLIKQIAEQLTHLQPVPELLTQVVRLIAGSFAYQEVELFENVESSLLLRASSSENAPGHAVEIPIGEGLVGTAARLGRTQASKSDDNLIVREVAVPLRVEEHILGVLHLRHNVTQQISPDQIELAEIVAAHLAIAMLEARNYSQQQEEAWITTVLLEVARHAAQPGDPEAALQNVLRLTTLLAGTDWAALLLPQANTGLLGLGPAAGLSRSVRLVVERIELQPADLGLAQPYSENDGISVLALPAPLASALQATEAMALPLTDGESLLGVLLLQSGELSGRRTSLLSGIAHQISLRLENTRLIEEAAARRTLEREIAMARDIQASFLPKTTPTEANWDVGATWRVAREVGGDFYDFIPLPDGPNGPRWGIVIADVADKGVPAALFMALCRTLLRSVAISRIDPGTTLARVNDLIFHDSRTDLFVSIFYGVWEPRTPVLRYANGGHNPPLFFQPGARPHALSEHSMVLGVEPAIAFTTHSLTFTPGSLLLLYTDGVTEAMDGQGDLFGVHRLENLVLGMPRWDAQDIVEKIAERVSGFTLEPDLRDDVTAVALHWQG